MADIVRLRARRFHALYQLLTGAAHTELPTPYQGSDHLRKDIGLPKQTFRGLTATQFEIFRTDLFHRAPQRQRPEQ
ncbi:hypothetical protein [Candidatus Rhodobacter oscarellae]|uniref:hypothetical protein n=1 Tax=Candidatus Rhodobacter oscarellae TaxID=1675527 RepID=UPI000A453BAB|nr:hypothetical protein [Candidatus Rhodobacter lobularis]